MKIKHNFKILDDGLTIQGQILETIFEGEEERCDGEKIYSKDRQFYLNSVVSPAFIGDVLYVWGSNKNKDNDVIKCTYETEEKAKKILAYINEFTIQEDEFIKGEQVAVSNNSKEEAIKDLKIEHNTYYYIGQNNKGEHIIEDQTGNIPRFKYVAKIPKIKKPKFKVGDYVVCEEGHEYMKIFSIQIGDTIKYNVTNEESTDYYQEDYLRVPTKEELNLYFR